MQSHHANSLTQFPAPARPHLNPTRPRVRLVTNSRPEESLLSAFARQGLLEHGAMRVRVRHGVAYLEGAAGNLRDKRLAEAVAYQTEGIDEVVNMMRIAPVFPLDDEVSKKRLTSSLASDQRMDGSRISAECTNGHARLSGLAGTAAAKRLAEEIAWSVPGVRDVANRLEVASVPPKSEVQTAGEILQGLSQCLGLDLSKVSVEVKRGIAYLRGTVPNEYLRSAAEELARWTPPVGDVVNELSVP